jgi:hypothetical protein
MTDRISGTTSDQWSDGDGDSDEPPAEMANRMCPGTMWPSSETTLQLTIYLPAVRLGIVSRISVEGVCAGDSNFCLVSAPF